MKDHFMKMAGVKTEAEFYKKYPTEDHFFAEHGPAIARMDDGGGVNISQFLPAGYVDPTDQMAGPQAPVVANNGVLINPSTTPYGLRESLGRYGPDPAIPDFPAAKSINGSAIGGAVANAIPGAMTLFDHSASAATKGSGIGGAIGGIGGSFLGPVGGMIGSSLGSAIGGLIGGKADRRHEYEKYEDSQTRKGKQWNMTSNVNPYGNNDSFYAEEGGTPEMQPAMPQEMPQESTNVPVNIEKGELAVDPISMEVVRSFKNKNRYSPHAGNPQKEAVGNHITLPDSAIVIPKKLSKRYEEGSKLTRRSILAELLKNQVNREHQEGMDNEMELGGAPKRIKRPVNISQFLPAGYVDPTDKIAPQAPPTQPYSDGVLVNPSTSPGLLDNLLGKQSAVPPAVNPEDQDWETPDPTEYSNQFKFPQVPKIGHISPVAVGQALTAIPTAVGMANAFGSDPYLNYNENQNFGDAAALLDQTPIDMNMEASKAAMARNFNSYARVLNNSNSPSVHAENANNFSKMMDATGQLYQTADNERKNRISQKLQGLASLRVQQGADQQQAREKLSTELRMDKANREGLIQRGLSEGITNTNKMIMDNERIRSLNSIAKYFKLNPYGKQLMEENPEAVQHIVEQVTEGYMPSFAPATTAKKDKGSTSVKRDAYGRIIQTTETKKG